MVSCIMMEINALPNPINTNDNLLIMIEVLMLKFVAFFLVQPVYYNDIQMDNYNQVRIQKFIKFCIH